MSSLKPEQSMNGAWIEAFDGGLRTDSAGNTSNWTAERIDSYIAKYKPAFHEAPLRIDHLDPGKQSNRGPAFGWIEDVKRDGLKVLVKLKEVQPQFEEWVKSGMIKKRSIKFDDQRGIHHLAFLGYNCPAVPGMENVYDDGDTGAVLTQAHSFGGYGDMQIARMFRRVKNWLIGKFGQEEADKALDEWDLQNITEEAARPEPESNESLAAYQQQEEDSMKPEEVQKIVTDAVTAATKAFSEQLDTITKDNSALREEVTGLRKQIGEQSDAVARSGFSEYVTSQLGRKIPEFRREAVVNEFMARSKQGDLEFDDGKGGKLTKSAVAVYKEELAQLPDVVAFGEHATKDKVGHDSTVVSNEFNGPVDEARMKLHSQALEYQEKNPGTTYDTAITVVMSKKGGK